MIRQDRTWFWPLCLTHTPYTDYYISLSRSQVSMSSTFYEQLLCQYSCTEKLQNQTVTREKLRKTRSCKNDACKMLMKLTPGWIQFNLSLNLDLVSSFHFVRLDLLSLNESLNRHIDNLFHKRHRNDFMPNLYQFVFDSVFLTKLEFPDKLNQISFLFGTKVIVNFDESFIQYN
jgi:hypothetical protein